MSHRHSVDCGGCTDGGTVSSVSLSDLLEFFDRFSSFFLFMRVSFYICARQ